MSRKQPAFGRRAPDERRAAILEAARAVLETKDYHAITMDDVARGAGVAKGSLYLHFPTKESLFRALMEDMHKSLLARWDDVERRIPAGAARIKALVDLQLDYFESHRGLFLQVFQGNLPAICHGSQKASGFVKVILSRMTRAIQEAVARREFRPVDVQAAAVGLFGLIRGFVYLHIIGAVPGRLPRQARELWELFYKGVRP